MRTAVYFSKVMFECNEKGYIMSRQNNFAKKQFFQKSISRAQVTQKRKKDILAFKNGEVMPDPVEVVETTDETVPDPEVIDE